MTRSIQYLAVAVLALPLAVVAQEYCDTTPISIPGAGTSGPASPYPATITVTGGPASISTMVVSLYGLSHTFPDDIDVLLVSPGGLNLVLQSDFGGAGDAVSLNYAISDSSPKTFGATLLESAYVRPGDEGSGDTFAVPAPPAPYNSPAPAGTATLASVFNGTSANGTWSLYIVDDAGGDIGGLFNGWCLRFVDPKIRISEFRVRGPGGANDEFIELRNVGNSAVTVADFRGGGGFTVASSDGVVRCLVPNGTVIPRHRHYLCANSVGYSLTAAPGGTADTPADVSYATDIADNAGIALFGTSIASDFALGRRLDAVGSTSEPNVLYKEGVGYPALTPFSIDYAFHRDTCGKQGSITDRHPCPLEGFTTDTDDNAVDFVFVDTNGTSAGAGQRLGSPGPQNAGSPTFGGSNIETVPLDACADIRLPPNVAHDTTSDPANNSTYGTITVRRRFINRTGVPLTRLRFRVIDLTTFPAPSGTTDLRPRNSVDSLVVVDVAPCGGPTSNVVVRGTTLEQPPSQPNGGGFNSVLSVPAVSAGTPLANNASIDVQFRFGVQQNGTFRAALVPEGRPQGGGLDDMVTVEGCSNPPCPALMFADGFE